MLFGVDLPDSLSDTPLRIDHVSDASRGAGRRLITRAVGHTNLSVGVAKQREWKIKLPGKSTVVLLGIKTDAEHLDVLGGVLLDSITESNAFGRSARRIGFRVKPEDDRASAQTAQPYLLARMGLGRKIRRLLSYLKHVDPPARAAPAR